VQCVPLMGLAVMLQMVLHNVGISEGWEGITMCMASCQGWHVSKGVLMGSRVMEAEERDPSRGGWGSSGSPVRGSPAVVPGSPMASAGMGSRVLMGGPGSGGSPVGGSPAAWSGVGRVSKVVGSKAGGPHG